VCQMLFTLEWFMNMRLTNVVCFFVMLMVTVTLLPAEPIPTPVSTNKKGDGGGKLAASTTQEFSTLRNLYRNSRVRVPKKSMVAINEQVASIEHDYSRMLSGAERSLARYKAPVTEAGMSVFVSKTPGDSLPGLAVRKLPLPKGAIVLQIPHSFFDRHTGDIGLSLFEKGFGDVIMWNSVHRSHLDVCHTDVSAFQALTKAIMRTSAAVLVQLHGFERTKSSRVDRDVDAIVSSGTRVPSPNARRMYQCLDKAFPDHSIRLYGENIFTLGGTTNAQLKAQQLYGKGSFVHIEMSKQLRELIKTSGSEGDRFGQCLRQIR
jgi:hypothetical protein